MAVGISFASSNSNTAGQSSYTFTAQGIGTASSDRVVIVGVWSRSASSGTTISSLTIGGTSATQLLQIGTTGTATGPLALYGLLVPSGTTADIVVTFGTTINRAAIGVWALTGTGGLATTSATASATSGSPAISTTLDIPANGGAIALAGDYSASSRTSTWSGITTEDVDIQPGTNGFSAAHDIFAAQQTGLTVTDTFSGATTFPLLICASWAPVATTRLLMLLGMGQ